MTHTEMLKELMETNDHIELGKAMSMSPRKMRHLVSGDLQWKAHDEKEVRSHYEMKKRVKEFKQRMSEHHV
jgi:hypothetical protein